MLAALRVLVDSGIRICEFVDGDRFHCVGLLVSVLGFAALSVHTYSVTLLKQFVNTYFPENSSYFRGCVEGYLGE